MQRILTPNRRLIAPRLWVPPRSRQRGFIDISFSSLPAHSGGGGGGWSPGPTNVTAVPDALGNGVDIFFTGPNAQSIPALTQYTGTLYNYPSGSPAGISASVNQNATTGGLSSYIRLNGVSAGSYTVGVTATNSNGASVQATSSSFTVVAASDYYISQGAASSSSTPQNTAWGSYTGSGTNYADTTGQIYSGQTNAISIAAGGLALPFYKNIWNSFGGNGNFYTDPYAHIVMLIYGTSFAGNVDLSTRYCGFCFGTVTSGGSNTFTDTSQNFVTNSWSPFSNGSFQNKGGSYAGNLSLSTNTVDTVTDTGSGGHNWSGDTMWMASIGDSDFPNSATSPAPISTGITTYTVAQFNSSGTQVGSATTLQPNVWNLVKVPWSVMNNQSTPTNSLKEFWYSHAMQEFRIANSSSNSTIYITNFGVTVA